MINLNIIPIRLSAFRAAFSSTAVCSQLVSHPLYRNVDWSRVTQGEYAVVDPNDPHSILYLDATDYVVQTRVSMTSRKKLIVLATPQDKAPASADTTFNDLSDSKPKASPHGVEGSSEDPHTFFSRSYRRWFNNPFRFVTRKKMEDSSSGESVGKSRLSSMVLISDGNIWSVIGHWALAVHVRLQGLGSQSVTRRETYTYVKSLRRILKGRGINYLIAYLKASMFVVNSFLGGTKMTNTWALGIGIRLTNGLPASLPIGVRRAIRNRNLTKIRLWVSIFYMYKAFWGFHKMPSLDTIEAKPFDVQKPECSQALSDFMMYVDTNLKPQLEFEYGVNFAPDLIVRKPFFTNKAGPNFKISLLGAYYDTMAWVFKYGLYSGDGTKYHSELIEYLKVTGNRNLIERFRALSVWGLSVWNFFEWTKMDSIEARLKGKEILSNLTGIIKPMVDQIFTSKYSDPTSGHMPEYFGLWSRIHEAVKLQVKNAIPLAGSILDQVSDAIRSKIKAIPGGDAHRLRLAKLSLILEPAGKVRVIAIMDWWTQTALIPMHDWLFETLKKGFGDTDATFDQEGTVKLFAEQGYKDLYSFDLKSATDLIPQQLYLTLLGSFLSKEVATAWLALLTRREFDTPMWKFKRRDGKTVARPIKVNGRTSVRYTRGQPMGALSSWGALALLHHALVRYSGFLAGDSHFRSYMVLGDDIVIAGKEVADKYKEVCESLGITLSLQKSYMSSEGLFNFASQTLLGNTNISPLSFRKELSLGDGFDRLSSVLSAVPRGLIDFSSASWLQQIARFVLPRSVYSEMEAQRLSGARHPVIQVLGALLCGATLQGSNPVWEALTKNEVTLPIRLLVKPGLALFSLKLSELVRGDRKTEFTIQAHKILDKVEGLLSTKLMRTREAFLKSLGTAFLSHDEVIFDEEGDVLDSVTISLGSLVDVVVKPNITPHLPAGKLFAVNEGQALKLLSIPFLASFNSFFVDRLRTLYNEARLSREARERNKILEGNWWEGGFKIDFGIEPRLKTLKTVQKDIQNMELSPKIVLDVHEMRTDIFSDSVLEYVFIGLMPGLEPEISFEKDMPQTDDLIPESSNARKEQNHPKTSSSL